MSLSVINSPPLVTAAGVGALAILSPLEQYVATAATLPLWQLKVANLCAYALNFWAVSRPGRIDSGAAIAEDDEKDSSKDDDEIVQEMRALSAKRGKTLVAPAGWAFAIWGPIFLGELIMVTAGQGLLVRAGTPLADRLTQMTGPFVVANLFQALWTASFRPKYKGPYRWVSAGMLGGVAYALSKAHTALLGLGGGPYLLMGLPLSLHFGWTTAATLVNINGSLAANLSEDEDNDNDSKTSSVLLAWVGHGSVWLATSLGVWITVRRRAPVYGGVIAWALSAVADGMRERIEAQGDEPTTKRQKRWSQAGAWISAAASAVVTVMVATNKFKKHHMAP